MKDMIEAIATVGFPIVAFLLIFYQSTITIKENSKALRELSLTLKSKRY